jgi:DNA/RNA-binding domain of Phe-tRNA-synthetase-like protein
MKKLHVSEEIFRSFPNVLLGVVSFQQIDNSGEHEEIMKALRAEEVRTVERFSGTPINDHPHIAAWREAYRKFGAKPKDYPSSIENLVRRAVKGHQLPHINLLVDIYNTISLRHIVPVGGEDLDQIRGDVQLTFATENEPPIRLLGESEERTPRPGEVIYKDDVGAICRRWNWKEADRTKFTKATVNGFLVLEGLPPVGRSLLEQALEALVQLVQSHCGGSVTQGVVDAGNAEIVLF